MAFILRIMMLLVLLTAGISSYSQVCDCATTGNCPVPIVDNGSYDGMLNVTVNGPNDLGQCPLTSVCFTITHTWIGDLSVSLTSPSGLNYMLMADVNNNYGGCGMQEDNVDICIVPGSFNPLAEDPTTGALGEYVCNPGPCDAGNGTCCLTGNWTVACNGVVDPINDAIEAPNCDLDDFNVPGDPANGTWTLTVVDVCNMDTGTLDNFSLTFACGTSTCIACEPDGGALDSIEVTSCFGSPILQLNLPPNHDPAPPPDSLYGYGYVISQNGVVLEVDTLEADLSNQPPGNYQVQGISYYLADSLALDGLVGLDTATVISELTSTTAPFCGGLSENWINVTVLPAIPPTTLDTAVCQGDCIMVGNQQVCSSSSVTLTSVNGCDSVINVTLTQVPPDDIDYTAIVCQGGCIDIAGMQYCTPGPHTITLTNEMGCDSVINLTFDEVSATAIIDPASPPSLTCMNGSVTLDGSSSMGDTYEWTGPNSFSSDQPSVTVTEPGNYTLTVYNNAADPPCQANTFVTVGDGLVPPNLIVVGAAPQICTGDDFDLSTLTIQDQNNTNPNITFHSGTPATPANELSSTIVTPTNATTYYILGTTGTCTDETSVQISVNGLPTADFTATASICATDEATITYAGGASAGAVYNWDFDGGVAAPGTGAGPHLVTWSSGGTHTISLTVEENGCISTVFTQEVNVDMPLQAPQIICDSTSTSAIFFSWPDVSGATGYDIDVLSSPSSGNGTQGPGNTYSFVGLNAGESVTIEVTAMGAGLCGNSSAEFTCYAENCNGVVLDITPVPDVCLGPTSTPFFLQATAIGGNGNGSFVWMGAGVSSDGNFDPELGFLGLNTLTLNYYEDNCVYSETVDIIIYETPLVAIDVPSFICAEDVITINFTGVTEPGSIYTWDFGGGTIVSTGTPGPVMEVIWPAAGTYDISLIVESPNNCISETLVLPISLEPSLAEPNIQCTVSAACVTFSWPIDPNASSYSVNFPDGHFAIEMSTSDEKIYEVCNLPPGEIVPISVQAIGPIPCGNASFDTFCETQACPSIEISFDPVNDICLTSSTTPITLTPTIIGDTSNGTLTWTGNGVDASGVFDPAQADLGANIISLSYEEGVCFYVETITINVFETPIADFTADGIICAGDATTLTYTGANNTNLNYTWDFDGGSSATVDGPGPHDVSWATGGTYTVTLIVENEDGCFSESTSTEVIVEAPIQMPVINCSATTSSIVFSWNSVPGVLDSTIVVSTPQQGVLLGNTYTINSLQPGTPVDFELTLIGAGACPSVVAQHSCTTENCPPITVDVEEVADICLGTSSPVQLNVLVTGSDGSGSGAWSGTGVDIANGTFDPSAAGFGTHILKYTFAEMACSYADSIFVNVYQQPTADFAADALICVADASVVTFNGTAGANANFNWDFDGGTAQPGTGPGPHQVFWDTPGNKTISLDIIDNGCTTTQFIQQIQVDEELTIPFVSCEATTATVEFSWDNVANATGYEIEILNQGSGPQLITDNSYLVSGLEPGEEVVLQLSIIGNTVCPPPVTTIPCSANLCSDVEVNIAPVDPICLTSAAGQATLEATVDGTSGAGSGLWSGLGIIDAVQGIFDPQVAGEGLHPIAYNYQLVNCTYTEIIEIKVAPPPTADAGENASLSCWGSSSSVRLGGDNTATGPNVIYEWTTVSGELPDNVTVLRPEVTEPGTYVLTVTDVELGCSSTDEIVISEFMDIPEPSISFAPSDCSGQNTTVAIENVTGGVEPYLYSINGEPYVAEDTFAFLMPGSYSLAVIDAMGCEGEIEFEVEELGGEINIELTANLVGRNHIYEGESIQLITLTNIPFDHIDSVVWSNPDLLSCTECLDPMATPTEATTFTLTAYLNGCEVTDEITIHVEYKSPIFVPTAFSPNADQVNDFLQVYTSPRVANIKSFMIFDRWGEMIHSHQDFSPDDPKGSWDGTLNGKEMDTAVFVWFAEVELIDGSTKLLEGEVSLIR